MCARLKENEPSNEFPIFSGFATGAYTWNINDKHKLQKIVNASNGELFESAPFSMCKLKCVLQLYPNGTDASLEGSSNVFLKLLSVPAGVDKITLSRTITCHETMAVYTTIDEFSREINRLSFYGNRRI